MGIGARLRGYFFAGILVFAPASITIWLAWKIVGFVDDGIRPLIPETWHPDAYLPFHLPGIGIVFVVTALVLIGNLTSGMFGRYFFQITAWVLSHIPVIRSVFGWSQQIFPTLLSTDSTAFRDVVLVEYPCRGSWAIGFITGQTEGEVQNLTSETVFNVFVPATPNPTTGFLLFLPEHDIHHLPISVDDGVKLVISGGIVKPPSEQPEASGWGHVTAIGDDLDRIRESLIKEREAEAFLEGGTVFGDELERIKADFGMPDRVVRPSLMSQLRDNLVTGILVTAPVAIPIWLAVELIGFFDDNVIPLIPDALNPETYLAFSIPGLGLIAAVLSMILLGFLSASFLGDAIVRSTERLLEGLPIVRGIYAAVKQIFESLFKKQSDAFSEVVLVQYPRPEAWAIGFVTGRAARSVQKTAQGDHLNIFLPTTPNPTSGFLLFLPAAETRRLTMSVEEGLKMVVSGGIVTPEVQHDLKEESG